MKGFCNYYTLKSGIHEPPSCKTSSNPSCIAFMHMNPPQNVLYHCTIETDLCDFKNIPVTVDFARKFP